jgi:hypothetical protein
MRISRSRISGLDDEQVCWAVVEPIWPSTDIDDELALLSKGTEGQQAIYSTMVFAQEVDNGGLKQFFGNSSGMLWAHVARGLKLLGAQEHAAVLSMAIRDFPGQAPSIERAERQHALREFTKEQQDRWRASEDHVYRLGGFFSTLRPLWSKYIEYHPEDFFLPA